jgi:lipopolysaccharide biosynthesis glycosyltransferase
MIPIFVGYDPREAVAYHTFCQSVISRASVPVSFIPLALNTLAGESSRRDGSNDFIYARFLVPWLSDFRGFAIYADGDMVVKADIAKLWQRRDPYKAVQVVKHDYRTKAGTKYLGNANEDYPRKNWSSVILWNCGHYRNRMLTPDYVRNHDGAHLHRFAWLQDDRIGELDKTWNHLPQEYGKADAKLIHWTLGTPCFPDYADSVQADDWHNEHKAAIQPL